MRHITQTSFIKNVGKTAAESQNSKPVLLVIMCLKKWLFPAAAACSGVLALLLLTCGNTAAQGVRDGISLCLASVIPALFPFFVAAQLLTALGAAEVLGRAAGPLFRRLFCIEASDYWRTHHIPGIASDEHPKRLGAFKANIIGINLVSVLQFAYGSVTGRETLRDSALTLLERLPAEDNRYMRNWRNTGVSIRNAFESQALLQLATEYCPAKRCTECPVGRRILQSISSTE